MIFLVLCIITEFWSLPAICQDNVSPLVNERVSIQTDRSIYIAGENLYFRLSLVNLSSSKNSKLSNYVYVLLRSENNTTVTKLRFHLQNDIAFGSLYLPDTLKTGIYQLVSFTNYMRNYGEESFATKEITIANRFDNDLSSLKFTNINPASDSASQHENIDNELSISCNKNEFGPRENVNVNLNIKDKMSLIGSSIALSIYNIPGDEIKNDSESDDFVDKKANYQSNNCVYLPEINETALQGQVIGSESGIAIPHALVLLSTVDSIDNLKFEYSDNSGNFCFLLNNFYDGKKLVIHVMDNPKAEIRLDDKFDLKKPFNPGARIFNYNVKDFIKANQQRLQVNKIYKLSDSISVFSEGKKPLYENMIYHHSDLVIHPSDYLQLPDFVEISRELLPTLKVRKKGIQYTASILDPDLQEFLGDRPAIFLDGVLIEDINQVIDLGTTRIKTIEMVNNKRYYGNFSMQGILSIYTTKDELNNVSWQTSVIKTSAVSDQLLASPYFTMSAKPNKREPDFRTLLYWTPNLKLNEDGTAQFSFFTSDCSGDFVIKAEGIGEDGKRIQASYVFKVVNQ